MFSRTDLAALAGILLAFTALPAGGVWAQDRAAHRNAEICWNEKADAAARIAECTRNINTLGPEWSFTSNAYLNRIMLYANAGKFDLAIKDSEVAARTFERDSLAGFFRMNRTRFLVQTGNFDRAIAALTSEIDRRVAPLDVLYQERASIWATRGDLDRAVADANEALLHAQKIDTYVQRASIHMKRGDFDAALADYDEVVRRFSTESEAYYTRAQFWHERRQTEKARADFGEAIRLAGVQKRYPWMFIYRAQFLSDLKEYDQALADIDEAIRRSPETAGLLRADRGDILRRRGSLDLALKEQDEAVRQYPNEASLRIKRGDTHRYRGDFRAAIADYNVALNQGALLTITGKTGRGLTHEKMGDRARARADFQAVLKAGEGQFLAGAERSSFETAQARLVALDSGVPQPVIAPVSGKMTDSVPTNDVVVPAVQPRMRVEQALPVKEPAVTPNVPAIAPAETPAAKAGRRVALVIGNSAYQKVTELKNPQKDANAVAAALRNVGFDHVSVALNASRDKLVEALRIFAGEADKAEWAMVYYAGHGIEVNGRNYLIPIDAAIKSDRDVQFETVLVDQVMSAIEGAKKIKLIVLDACRDNPFVPVMERTVGQDVLAAPSTAGASIVTRSVGRGLGEVKVSGASLVVFAAKHGQTALDGDGGNSPFAVALVQRIATPGVEINKIFRLVRDDVMEATAGRQEPYTYGSLPGREDFFFVASR